MKNPSFKLLLPPLLSLVLIIGLFSLKGHTLFDESAFEIDQVENHLQTLTSTALKGRGLSEPGQLATEAYLESYFKANQLTYEVVANRLLIPVWEPDTLIQISDRQLKLYKDFKPTADYFGAGLDYRGDVLYAGRDLTQINPALMKNRVVCFYANRLTEDHINLARAAGAKGLLYHISFITFDSGQTEGLQYHKTVDMSHKQGADLFMAEINKDTLAFLRNQALKHPLAEYTRLKPMDTSGYAEERLVGTIPNVQISAKLNYQLTPVKNYIVTIPGKQHRLSSNFVTHYDGLGLMINRKDFYPSAIEGGISTSLLLEMARTAKVQGKQPLHDINFVFLSGLAVNDSSSVKVASYINDKHDYQATWLIESIGYKQSPGYLMSWNPYNDFDRMLVSQLYKNLRDFPSNPQYTGELTYTQFDRYDAFGNIDHANLLITDALGKDAYTVLGTPRDSVDQYNKALVEDYSNLMLGYMNRQVYAETDYAFMKNGHLLILLVLLFIMHLLALPEKWTALGNAPASMVKLAEQVPYKVLRRAVTATLPFVLSIFIVNLVLSVPSDVNLKTVGSHHITNFSFYDTFKYSYMGFIAFLSALVNPAPDLYKEISLYLSRSLILILWGLGLAIGLGLLKGLMDAYWHKGKIGLSTLSGIILYSIPDVLIAFLSLVAVVYLSKVGWLSRWIDPTVMRLYVMPILSLTIVPVIYISRIVFVALEEEKSKEYVKFLQYKGLSQKQIYLRHFSKVGLIKILDAAKAIIMLLFSNLIVVEYLFNYPGIMYNLLDSNNGPIRIIILSLSIGVSFMMIYLLSVLALHIIHPGRRMQ